MKERIEVLFCIDAMTRGGTELQLRGLLDHLDRDRFAPHLCTLRAGDPLVAPADLPHLDWRVAGLLRPGGLLAIRRLAGYLREHAIDVVQTYHPDSTAFGGTAAWLAGVPVRVASFRDLGFWRRPLQVVLLRQVYRRMTGFMANSSAVRDHVCAADGLDPRRVQVIPNGIDPEAFVYREPETSPRVVGILANLNRPVKRVDLFVEAAGRLGRDFPDVTWEIAGEGRLRAQLEHRAAELDISRRMRFLGRRDDVREILARWDVGVLCSDSEGFSNALLEYMASGCAAVATAVGGNVDAIRDRENGLLVRPDDAEGLAAAVRELLRTEGLAGRLAARARRDLVQRFSWEACARAHEEYYVEQLESRPGRRRVAGASTGARLD
ncbi:MAG: glycosyltransferase [Candidatus Krumholzibacteriia bacterium]